MKNWIQPGDTVTVVAPATLTSGSGFLVGTLFGVALSDAASGDNVEMAVTGVADLPKAAVAITQGAKVYWISATNNVTNSAAGSLPCLRANQTLRQEYQKISATDSVM